MNKKEKVSVVGQIDDGVHKQQLKARESLLKIISSIKYLACQGLAIQGHNNDDGNFIVLLNLSAEDCPDFSSWLKQRKSLHF